MTSNTRLHVRPLRTRATGWAGILVLAGSMAACGGSPIAGTGAPVSAATSSTAIPSDSNSNTYDSTTAGTPGTSETSGAPSSDLPTGTAGPESSTESTPATPGSISSHRNPDACTLLTRQDATSLAGMEVQDAVGEAPVDGVNTGCRYTRDPNAGGTAQVTLTIGDEAKTTLDTDKDALGHTFTQVPNIADEAWQEDGAIFLRKATTWVAIQLVLLRDPAASVQPLQQAALIAAGRI